MPATSRSLTRVLQRHRHQNARQSRGTQTRSAPGDCLDARSGRVKIASAMAV